MNNIIYLDNNATTAVSPDMQDVIKRYLDIYANPSSLHFYGTRVSEDIQKAREKIARTINADPEEIIFTASGSEANNLCIKGYCEANKEKGNHIIVSSIEHPSVINTCKHLEKQGYTVTYLKVDKEGFVSVYDLEKAIKEETALVSVMHVNNEIGSIQDIERISEICIKHSIVFHTDAVQSYLKLPIDVKRMNISLASFTGHKVHAPKGIGFIFKKKGIKIEKQIDGGSQEYNLRAGTENVPYIMGLAEAMQEFSNTNLGHVKSLQRFLLDELLSIQGVRLNGPDNTDRRICTNVNVSFENLEAEIILQKLSEKGICVSTGSACSSKSTKVSSVLLAISCPVEYVHGNIRISLSKYTTKNDLEYFVTTLKDILANSLSQKVFTK